MARRRPLDVRQILEWADAHFARTGQYPDVTCGRVYEAPWEKWINIDGNLRHGGRELPGGWSLAQLLDELRGKRNVQNLPRHRIEEILSWADAYFARAGMWPSHQSGSVAEAPDETWQAIDMALRAGGRGLGGGSSLARLLREHRGARRMRHRRERLAVAPPATTNTHKPVTGNDDARLMIEQLREGRNIQALPPFTIEQILGWVDEFFVLNGDWPSREDGLIGGTEGETWGAVEAALSHGLRGLPGGSSLPRLLAEQRGVRNPRKLPPLSVEQILDWADVYRDRTGDWPTGLSGAVDGLGGDTWLAVDKALRAGRRGLRAGSSLARLLDEHRGTRRAQNPAPLSVTKILGWADAWFLLHGKWPTDASGSIPESPGDTWNAISIALRNGLRDLPGGMSLAVFLADRRGKRNRAALPPLTEQQILAWADAHYERHGKWPKQTSGPAEEAAGESWDGLDQSLRHGRRGLPGGSSLAQLLAQHRCKRNPRALPPLTEEQILAWADAFHECHGKWPHVNSGAVQGVAGETWSKIDHVLVAGSRGLSGGSSLSRLLAERRGKRNPRALPPLAEEEILGWADAFFARHGKWPTVKSGPVSEAPGETWRGLDEFLKSGRRGLPRGSSLAKLLDRYRRDVPAAVGCATGNGVRLPQMVDAPNGERGPAATLPVVRVSADSNDRAVNIRPKYPK